jgi:Spondin_N
MSRRLKRGALALAGVALGVLAVAPPAMARDYEVTVENLTSGQAFSPPVVATHKGRGVIFEVGQPASVGVREIAENGNNKPLLAFLDADPFDQVRRFLEGPEPLVPDGRPGQSMGFDDVAMYTIRGRASDRLSLATMLICTNDGFTGVNGIKLPGGMGKSVSRETNGYDAHTEVNTEDYADLVPPCQGLIGAPPGQPMGTANSNPDLAEGGVIAHHEGIQGGVDLDPSLQGHGWSDPVARVTVERTG